MPEKKLDTHFEVVISFENKKFAECVTDTIYRMPYMGQGSVEVREVAN